MTTVSAEPMIAKQLTQLLLKQISKTETVPEDAVILDFLSG
jgi:hypothetical protein